MRSRVKEGERAEVLGGLKVLVLLFSHSSGTAILYLCFCTGHSNLHPHGVYDSSPFSVSLTAFFVATLFIVAITSGARGVS